MPGLMLVGPMSNDVGGILIPHTKQNCKMCQLSRCRFLGSNTHSTSKNRPRCHTCKFPRRKCTCSK